MDHFNMEKKKCYPMLKLKIDIKFGHFTTAKLEEWGSASRASVTKAYLDIQNIRQADETSFARSSRCQSRLSLVWPSLWTLSVTQSCPQIRANGLVKLTLNYSHLGHHHRHHKGEREYKERMAIAVPGCERVELKVNFNIKLRKCYRRSVSA